MRALIASVLDFVVNGLLVFSKGFSMRITFAATLLSTGKRHVCPFAMFSIVLVSERIQ
jgi:hypothetical protein